jgi:hypothetical protein
MLTAMTALILVRHQTMGPDHKVAEILHRCILVLSDDIAYRTAATAGTRLVRSLF